MQQKTRLFQLKQQVEIDILFTLQQCFSLPIFNIPADLRISSEQVEVSVDQPYHLNVTVTVTSLDALGNGL